MSLFRQYKEKRFRWGIWKVEEEFNQLLAELPLEGREHYLNGLENFTSLARRKEWLAIRVLLYKLLGEMKPIAYKPSGKPYFEDGSGFLSISHTKGYVAVIVSEQCEVGIDIEQVKDRVLKIAHKFVNEEEEKQIQPEEKVTSLLLIWSAKEVMFKCMEEEGVDFREHLSVNFPSSCAFRLSCAESRTAAHRSFSIDYMLHPDFVMTWTAF